MLENLPTISEEEELNEAIDQSLAEIPLDLTEQEQHIVDNIITAPTQRDLEDQFALFNINQTKKNALRIVKLNQLLGKIEDQAIERFNKTPENISNRELLEYMQVVANQIDRSQKSIDTLTTKPMIKVNNPKTEVNINIGTELNRDSKEKVVDAIQSLLRQLNTQASEEAIEGEIVTPAEYTDVDNEPIIDNEEGEEN